GDEPRRLGRPSVDRRPDAGRARRRRPPRADPQRCAARRAHPGRPARADPGCRPHAAGRWRRRVARRRARLPRAGAGVTMRVRRVVTGYDRAGKSVVAEDREVEAVTLSALPGSEFHRLWGADVAPSFPDAGVMPPHHTYFPPAGGFRFGFFTV